MNEQKSSAEHRFPAEVERILLENGWFPRRQIPTDLLRQWLVLNLKLGSGSIQVRMFPAASIVLREFGGLKVKLDLPGISCYRPSFDFDPSVVQNSGAWNYNWVGDEGDVNGGLFPLGRMSDGGMFAVDSRERIINDNGQLVGNNIDEALTNMILGIMPQPLEVEQRISDEANFLFPLVEKIIGEA